MNPAVTAAWIAAGISLLTLLGSMGMQAFGIRRVSKDTNVVVREQLEQQRDQLDRTIAEERSRTFNDRFATAADRLGMEAAATRLAGVYALAGLADDWPDGRQTCIDVLCAYLRLPYDADPGSEKYSWDEREIRRTLIRVIRDHLRPGFSTVSWSTCKFSFEGAVFDCGDLSGIHLDAPGLMTFHGCRFAAEKFFLDHAVINGARMWFTRAIFAHGTVTFAGTQFSGSVSFNEATFDGADVTFAGSREEGAGRVTFNGVTQAAGQVDWGPFRERVESGSTAISPVK
jgi:hypothetical protein